MNLSIGDEFDLTIDRLSYDGGRGVGRFENFVFFVSETAPQEKIRAQVTRLKKNYGEARLVKILEPSPHRRQPQCSVANHCGGCTWQHISYEEQLRQKAMLLKHHLKSVLPEAAFDVQSAETGGRQTSISSSIRPSPSEFRYRNRVQVHIQTTPNLQYGFFAKGTNQIVPIHDCLISEEKLFSGLAEDLRGKFVDPLAKKAKMELSLDENGSRLIRDLSEADSEFTQVNSRLNTSMQEYVVGQFLKWTRSIPIRKVYDLYCGSGNLSFPVADASPQTPLLGVEFNRKAVNLANHKSQLRRSRANGPDQNIKFIASDVGNYLAELEPEPSIAMILDPPRAGLGTRITRQIIHLKPHLLIYVSCSLPTLIRDLQELSSESFDIIAVTAFDMFPQTPYLETIVTLVPRATLEF